MRIIFLLSLVLFGADRLKSQPTNTGIPATFTNLILPGSYPDPSICRVDITYYLVNSSFIWYPGVPIHGSKDLVNWELIGYVLNTPEHLDVNDRAGTFAGIWAPTLRYNKGLFYLTVTQKNCGTGANNHNVSVFKSNQPAGPYKPCPHNPVLTHRGTHSPFSTIGHADFDYFIYKPLKN